MSCRRRFFITSGWFALFATVVAATSAAVVSVGTLTQLDGRVMLRSVHAGGGSRVEFPKAGRTVVEDEVLITGEQSLFELRVGESGWWRVGRRAVLAPQVDGGGRLTAGTALVRVSAPAGWRIEAAKGAARLGPGLWMLQAVDNEGLKIVCLDGPAEVTALGPALPSGAPTPGASAAVPAQTDRLKLRPGELVFLRPGGTAFGPIVVIYLEELVATSRLVNGFAAPLTELRRLRNLGVVQREQLKGVTNALVAGARDDKGFEIAVPAPSAAPAKPQK